MEIVGMFLQRGISWKRKAIKENNCFITPSSVLLTYLVGKVWAQSLAWSWKVKKKKHIVSLLATGTITVPVNLSLFALNSLFVALNRSAGNGQIKGLPPLHSISVLLSFWSGNVVGQQSSHFFPPQWTCMIKRLLQFLLQHLYWQLWPEGLPIP